MSKVEDTYKTKPGKITGVASYDGKSGIKLKSDALITIEGPLVPINTFVRTLCFNFAFQYTEPLGDTYVLFSRGPKEKEYSIFVELNKERKTVIKVNYLTIAGTISNREFVDNKTVSAGEFHELSACFTQAIDFMSSAMIFLDGVANFFEVKKSVFFNWDENASSNNILASGQGSAGFVNLYLFSVIEGAGGFIFSQENHSEV